MRIAQLIANIAGSDVVTRRGHVAWPVCVNRPGSYMLHHSLLRGAELRVAPKGGTV